MLNKTNTGLIVVDIQGKLAEIVEQSERLIENCQKLISGAQTLSLPIIWLEQNPQKLGPTNEAVSQLLTQQTAITKFTFNACNQTRFIEEVTASGINNWLICGIEAHICVYQTARGLIERGYKVHLVTDCVSSRSKQNLTLALNKMAEIGVQSTGVEMCLYELVEDCRNKEFKPILKLIK